MEEFEISKHSLVPKHVLLKQDEAKELLKKFNIRINQLPKISRKDPAIISLDAKVGDIIRIVRKSSTAGETEYFRTVTDD